MRHYNRRQFIKTAAAGTGALAAAACLDVTPPKPLTKADATIIARPIVPTKNPTVGYSALGIATPRDGFLYVPTTYDSSNPSPLLLLLHPNGSGAEYWETYQVGELLDDLRMVVVAPDSRAPNWDFITNNGFFALDPNYFNVALAHTFERCAINPNRIAIAGFSDGGIEAMGVGLANGDLFSHIAAYSPGALVAPFESLPTRPDFWISHGQTDEQFSFDFTKDQIAGKLTTAGYNTTFVPFAGGHTIPSTVLRQSAEWMVA